MILLSDEDWAAFQEALQNPSEPTPALKRLFTGEDLVSKRGPDFQKKEAKQSLWDMDGTHVKKRHRNKGKGRGKDKKLIESEILAVHHPVVAEQEDDLNKETNESLYCVFYSPWAKCRALLEAEQPDTEEEK